MGKIKEFIEKVSQSDAERRKLARENELNDIRNILKSDSGVRFFRRLFDHCGLFKQPAGRLGIEDKQTYLACGHLDIGLWVLSEVDHSIKEPELMGRLLFREVVNEVDKS